MKHASKKAFLDRTDQEWRSMWQLVDQVTDRSTNPMTKEQVRQILAHLYAWHVLLNGWLKTGADGNPNVPHKDFTWRQTRELNAMLDQQYASIDLKSIRKRLRNSHTRLTKKVLAIPEKTLMNRDQYAWTGSSTLCGYIGANTCSHYRWAQQKLKRILKQLT